MAPEPMNASRWGVRAVDTDLVRVNINGLLFDFDPPGAADLAQTIRVILGIEEPAPERAEQVKAELAKREADVELGDMKISELSRIMLRLQKRAAHNEAAIERVRRLCELTIAASCRTQAIAQAYDTLAALDAPQRPENTPNGSGRSVGTGGRTYNSPSTPEDTREETTTRLIRCDRHSKTWSGNRETFQDCPDCTLVTAETEGPK